jgi:hypothetical protein
MTAGLRTVVREPRFEEEAAAIQPNARRMDEALQYVEYELARYPDSGIESSVPGIWVAPVRVPKEGWIVRGSVFYTFDADHVRLQSIRLAT